MNNWTYKTPIGLRDYIIATYIQKHIQPKQMPLYIPQTFIDAVDRMAANELASKDR